MQTKEARNLLNRYFAGECTDEEEALIQYWFHQLNTDNETGLSETELLQMNQDIWKQLNPSVARPMTKKTFWPRIAVAASLLFGILMVWQFSKKRTITQQENTFAAADIAPGGNKAFLKLSNGKMINVDSLKIGEVKTENTSEIKKTASGALVYTEKARGKSEVNNTIFVPRGGQYQLTLSDGSKIWLNAESSLSYPVAFRGKLRQVELKGEAYFEIAHNAASPFQVISGKQVVKVLGTHFNIKSYEEDKFSETTLLEGSVRVSTAKQNRTIKPGEQVTRNKESLTVSQVDTRYAMAWKEGFFRFKNEKLTEVMKSLSRWYNIEIVFQDKIDEEGFNGQISRYKNIRQVLKMLENTEVAHFKIEGRRVIVTK